MPVHESLMHHDSQKFIFYDNFNLIFPVYDRKDFDFFFTFEEVTNVAFSLSSS